MEKSTFIIHQKHINGRHQMNKQNGAEKQRHSKLEQLRAKVDQIEMEVQRVIDQLKGCQLAGKAQMSGKNGEIKRSMEAKMQSENALIKERIRANVTQMEEHCEKLRENQKGTNDKFFELDKMLVKLLREGQTHLDVPSFSVLAATNNSFLPHKNLKPPIWSIDLFERLQFRNGSSKAQCMECGQKFATTDEAAMGWHIVREHAQYAAKLLQKQLEEGEEQQQRHGTEVTAQQRKRKATKEEQKKTKSKLFRDL